MKRTMHGSKIMLIFVVEYMTRRRLFDGRNHGNLWGVVRSPTNKLMSRVVQELFGKLYLIANPLAHLPSTGYFS